MDQSQFLPEIRVGRLGILKLYVISDEELGRLEHGSGQGVFLNIGIAVLSVAVSLLVALMTTNMSDRIFLAFVVVTAVGFVAGLTLLILWWCTRRPVSSLVKDIRGRMPPQGEAQLAPVQQSPFGPLEQAKQLES